MGYKILDKIELCPNQYELKIKAPFVTRNAQAGQFIIFRVEENGERVPITIADVDREHGILTVVFMAVGIIPGLTGKDFGYRNILFDNDRLRFCRFGIAKKRRCSQSYR